MVRHAATTSGAAWTAIAYVTEKPAYTHAYRRTSSHQVTQSVQLPGGRP